MGIDLVLRNLRHRELHSVPDVHNLLSGLIQKPRWPLGPSLSSLNPYGTTRVQHSQAAGLQTELRSLLAQIPDSDLREHLRRVESLVARSCADSGTYLTFDGD